MDKLSKLKIGKFIFPLMAVVAVVAIASAGYFYMQLNKLQNNPDAVAQEETNNLVAQVSKLIMLPEGETPTVATVSDPEALKDQPFFASAKIGDKILIYAQAKKAILYSVSLNKILDVAPLNIGEQEQTTSGAQTQTTTTSNEESSE